MSWSRQRRGWKTISLQKMCSLVSRFTIQTSMLAKSFKLTGKDVRFLLRKKWLVYGKGMVFVVYEQYPDRQYNQWSLQVSTKISKSSVKRNMIKRLFFKQLEEDLPVKENIGGKYYKIFVYFHKLLPDILTKLLANAEKNTINSEIAAHFHEHFTTFPDLLCRYLDSSKTSDTPSRKGQRVSKPQNRKSSKK